LPPVDFRAVCFVRAMVDDVVAKLVFFVRESCSLFSTVRIMAYYVRLKIAVVKNKLAVVARQTAADSGGVEIAYSQSA
jgi:hypothetical protein